ncbi:MAG: zinc ribbon domain-containing protein [Chloroflexi bacterium]|nr:zinc ribbon domain-containing protein [Chloroflexota bacterium]MBL7062273.1 zinc ribbon domain-containing protein [Dehalococcoidia bacterium]
MPIYEYLCSECNCKFELLRSISKVNEETSCPQCQHTAKRVFSRFASFSKGSDGESTPIAGTASSCSSCTASSCSSCSI